MEIAHTLLRGATAPVRLGLSAGELGLSVARAALGEARRTLSPHDSQTSDGWRPATPPPVRAPEPDIRGHGDPLAPLDQPSVVPVTAEGVGAEVHVDPPWEGYDKMTAAEIRRRLSGADGEVAAAVSLYEGAGRGRRSVVEAADRRLRAARR